LGTFEAQDAGTLRSYCCTLARAQQLDAIAAAMPTVETPSGPKPHPIGVEARKLHKLAQSVGKDLGMSYTARSRAGAPATPQDEEARKRLAETEGTERIRANVKTGPVTRSGSATAAESGRTCRGAARKRGRASALHWRSANCLLQIHFDRRVSAGRDGHLPQRAAEKLVLDL
jgi:hypothetical protein